MTVEVLEIDKWQAFSKAYKVGVFGDVVLLNTICEVYGVKSLPIVVRKGDKPIMAIVCFVKGRRIVHPTSNIYTCVWTAETTSINIQDACYKLLDELKKKFVKISILLPPGFDDIRAFINSGFKSDVKYTLVNKLDKIKPSKTILEKCVQASKTEINFVVDIPIKEPLVLLENFYRKLGYSETTITTISSMLEKLQAGGIIKPFGAYLGHKLIACSFQLLDTNGLTAYNLFLTSNKENYQTGVQGALYMFIFDQLQHKGIAQIDLFGATSRGVGNFKQFFNGELKPYYFVRYYRFRWTVVKLFKKFDQLKLRWMTRS